MLSELNPPALIVGMIVRNEMKMLSSTLPKTAPFADHIVAIDAQSTDGTVALLEASGAQVEVEPWKNYSHARNKCINLAERLHQKPACMLMLDADEAITARDFSVIRSVIAEPGFKSAAIARYEFVDDLFHFNPVFYPDFQARCFTLHDGFHYQGVVHEQLCARGQQFAAVQTGDCVLLPYVHIFHYGKCKDIKLVWLKYANYQRLNDGLPLLEEPPPDTVFPASFSSGTRLMFHGERPL